MEKQRAAHAWGLAAGIMITLTCVFGYRAFVGPPSFFAVLLIGSSVGYLTRAYVEKSLRRGYP